MINNIEELRVKQYEELRQLILKLAGKKHGKVSKNKVKKLAEKHSKQLHRAVVKLSKKEAKKQYNEECHCKDYKELHEYIGDHKICPYCSKETGDKDVL